MHLPFISIVKSIFLFFFLIFSIGVNSQENIASNMKKAQATFARLDAENNYKDNLNHADMNILPMGISQTISNMGITLAVHSAEFFTEYTELGIFLRLDVPGREGKPLMFGAENIKLSHDGDIIGDARLVLMSDIEVPISGENVIMRLKGDYNNKTGQTSGLTYVTIDCRGFKQLSIDADIELSRKLCIPVSPTGEIIKDEKQKVKGSFRTQAENWTDIVAKVSLPSFEIKGLSGFVWNLQDAVFDFSDTKNEQAFSFPSGYQQYLIPGNEVLWKGIYAKELSVTLPPQFSKNGDKRVSFFAQGMLIDENGVTGNFGVENILSFDEGNASGWAFSVDHFSLKLLANHLEEARFKGVLGLPVSENAKFLYDGQIAEDKYIMRVSPVDKMVFDLFRAKAEIDPNSYVEFKVVDNKFRPEAILHGRMGIEVTKDSNSNDNANQKSLATIQGVEFRSLHLKTEAPYFTAEYFGYKGDARLGNFPVSINEIALVSRGNEAALAIEVDVALAGNIKGKTRFEIVGSMNEGSLHRWKYDRLNFSQIELDATIAEIIELKGGLKIMDEDPVYGDGFEGTIAMNFKGGPLPGLSVEARAMFGRKDFDYWCVDGIADIPTVGIPIGPGINLTGFGGGLAYRMKPQGADRGAKGQIMTATSMSYVPDEKYALGIKAATVFNFGEDKIANGEACFELAFNNNGGLNYAGFYGYAQFLSAIPGLENISKSIGDKYQNIVKLENAAKAGLGESAIETLQKTKQYNPNDAAKLYTEDDKKLGNASFTASLGLQYNFAESSFHANFDLYVNVLGGVISGIGSNNRAGHAVIHVDPQDWYIHMGTPTDRIGLRMGIGKLLSIETGSYLMVGTQIPAAPGPPHQVASILGEDPQKLNYMKDLNQIEGGKGFAFGSSLSVNTGDLTFLILYANYSAGLGFDIMLKDYGDAQCKGHSGAIGMDGWYANGQAYAYMHGELGVKVNLWFIKAKIPIISADFAALMQAKLPNPSSFKAYLAIKAKVLGIVSVNCRFKILVGDDCELVIPGGSPVDMLMISDLSPTDRSNEVSVFTAPQATFSMAMEKPFNVQDDSGEKTFRIKLKDFKLADGQDITGEIKWNGDKDVASFYSHEVLPPQKDIVATVNVVFEEYSNGRWYPIITGGKEAMETKTIRFKTSDAPKDIPLRNIVYSYPVVDQKYYLKGESGKGYVQLQHGQSYLFPSDMKNQVEIKDNTGNIQQVDFTYNESKRRIEYTMPATQNSTGYTFSILSLSKGGNNQSATAINTTSLLNDEEDGNISIDKKQANAAIRTDVGSVLLTYDFASSKYSTFKQKIDDIRKTIPAVNKLSSDILMFEYETVGMEPFDLAELTGTSQSENKPLIDVYATLDEYYYKERVYPLVYKDYPILGQFRVKNRDENELGIPPAKALPIMTTYLNKLEAGQYTGFVTTRFPYYYNLPQVYKEDFVNLQHQVVNSQLGATSNPAYTRFVVGRFPFISPGAYRIKLDYVMPGGVKGTSAMFEYENFIE